MCAYHCNWESIKTTTILYSFCSATYIVFAVKVIKQLHLVTNWHSQRRICQICKIRKFREKMSPYPTQFNSNGSQGITWKGVYNYKGQGLPCIWLFFLYLAQWELLKQQSSSKTQTKADLYQYFLLPIVFTEFFRRTTFLLLEYTVEVGEIVETALITDFSDRHRGVYQQPRCKPQTNIDYIVG